MRKQRFFKTYRRKGKTNYHKRLSLLKSGLTRLIVRISSKNIVAQLVEYNPNGDQILCAVSTKSLEKLGWNLSKTNIPAAYLVGYLLAKKSKDIKKAILDIGEKSSVIHSRIYAVVKGVVDGGVEVPVSQEVLPSEERINGNHIKTYAENMLKEDKQKYEAKFSLYLKNNLKPEMITDYFQQVKSKIDKE